MKPIEWLKLIFSVLVCELVGILGAFFTTPGIEGPSTGSELSWYENLAKPVFAPPNWIFAPAWITLYALMGVAAYLVWREGIKRREVRLALVIFDVQLVLNGLWSPLFFGLRSPLAGLVDIGLLWLAIIATIILFARISKPAAWLLAPYFAWVSFAAALNFAIWILN